MGKLASPIHERRFAALEILAAKYKGNERTVYDFYLKNTHWVNNWDLVDTSAPYSAGQHLLTRQRRVLYRLATSQSLERRIALVSTMPLIRAGQLEDTFAIAKILTSTI